MEKAKPGSFAGRPHCEQIEEALLNFLQLFLQAEIRGTEFSFEDAVLVIHFSIPNPFDAGCARDARKILLPSFALTRLNANGYTRTFTHVLHGQANQRRHQHGIDLRLAMKDLGRDSESELNDFRLDPAVIPVPF